VRPATSGLTNTLRRRLNREVVGFAAVGAINTVLDFGLFYALISLGPLKANVISTLAATTSSYLMNRYWTYRDRAGGQAVHREYLLFFGFNLVGLGIQEAILGTAKYGLGLHEGDSSLELLLFKAFGVAVAMVFRFWAYRTFVFTSTPAERAELAEFVTLADPVEAELLARLGDAESGPVTAARPAEVSTSAAAG
jgi:putative flippase GtrA